MILAVLAIFSPPIRCTERFTRPRGRAFGNSEWAMPGQSARAMHRLSAVCGPAGPRATRQCGGSDLHPGHSATRTPEAKTRKVRQTSPCIRSPTEFNSEKRLDYRISPAEKQGGKWRKRRIWEKKRKATAKTQVSKGCLPNATQCHNLPREREIRKHSHDGVRCAA